MKKSLIISLLIAIVLTACGGNPQPTTAASTTVASVPATATGAVVNNPAITTSTTTGVVISTNDSATATNTAPVTVANPADCTDSASFVADVTVPDNELIQPGQKFDKIWRIKNAGTCAWTEQYKVVLAKADKIKAPDTLPLQDIPPGNTVDIAVNLTAPSDENVSRARADFEIRNPIGAAIPIDTGTTLWVIIQVDNGTAPKNNSGETGGGSSGGSSGPGYAAATCGYTTNPAKVNEVIAALNAYRAQQGLAPYAINAQLTEAAQAHSADMACNQLFYHNGSNGSTAKSRVAASGYVATAVTENVYGSYPPLSGPDVILWWANDFADPRHNQNLLSTRYVEIGIGYSYYNNFGYFVIDFAVP